MRPPQRVGPVDRLRTVSYTHLRAHETRHDLVCRLLLEKNGVHRDIHRVDRRQRQMCIRDRDKGTQIEVTRLYAPAAEGWAGGQAQDCLLYTSPSPRTRHDLVCRLLLEKKKKKPLRTRNNQRNTKQQENNKHTTP